MAKPERLSFFLCGLMLLLFIDGALGGDWLTYQHDNHRSGVTREKIDLPLFENWRYQAETVPQPAWPDPAKTDYWHREANLKPRVIFDRAFHVVGAGEAIYFGSSANDKVYCLDANSGTERWSFFTSGPVRLAPTIFGNKLYCGSDDGLIYCLNRNSGELLWQFNPAEKKRRLPGNERIISICPVRSGVLVADGVAYFASGIFPNEGVQLFALDARDGSVLWSQPQETLSPQGYLLASKTQLFVPTGRTTPVIFNRTNGERLGAFRGNGGTYAILDESTLIYGGGDLGKLEIREPDSKEQIASFNGVQMIVQGNISYLRSDRELMALDRSCYQNHFQSRQKILKRKEKLANKAWDLREKQKLTRDKKNLAAIDRRLDQTLDELMAVEALLADTASNGILWKQKIPPVYVMILAGDILILGGENEVFALRATDGTRVWQGKTGGKVYSLAIVNGQLFASTDSGVIHCFNSRKVSRPKIWQPKVTKDPFPSDKQIEHAAKEIIRKSGISKGYGLILGIGSGKLAFELARQSNLNILGIEPNADKVKQARERLDAAGLYGQRVHFIPAPLDKLPLSQYFANLIVSELALKTGSLETPVTEVFRVLRPFGGVAFLGSFRENPAVWESWYQAASGWKIENKNGTWVSLQRGKVAGSGEWTQLYANPQNSACSMDQLSGPVQIQWFGRPGPRKIINRHSRPMSPLFKDGRLFINADNLIIAADAYNGTPLWELSVPNSRRLGALKDCGHVILKENRLYVAVEDECWTVDVVDGRVLKKFRAPQVGKSLRSDWGYLSATDKLLFGSGKIPGSSFQILGRFNCDELEGDFREMIFSNYLFAVDRNSGQQRWIHQEGVVFNNTIVIGNDDIFFVESRNPVAIADPDGRLRIDTFCEKETFLVRLNGETGQKIWEKPVQFPFQQIMYLSFAQNILLVTGSHNAGSQVNYSLFAFDATTGAQKWENHYQGGDTRWQVRDNKKTIGGSHGEQWQHPVIVENRIFLPPYDFDLQTGKQGKYVLHRGGHGCGGLSASADYLFARGGNPRLYPMTNGQQSGIPLTRVNRPGCWINIIPAGGLIMLPESSSGCTCDYPIQTSFVFVPQN